MQKERQSAFEFLRIIAQIMIVYYHILLIGIYPTSGIPFYKALWLPLHIGVPLFVMISGYFEIKPSVRGFVKLIGMVFVLSLPVMVMDYLEVGGAKSIIKGLFCISRTHFWFIRTYVILYLLSPLVNAFLKNANLKSRISLFLALFFISDYMGTVGNDPALYEGYNIVTFMLFYVVGNSIHKYKDLLSRYSFKNLMIIWLISNTVFVGLFSVLGFSNRMINSTYIWILFEYTSPGLLISSSLFFIAISQLHFRSHLINRIAKASLAIYIIHGAFMIGYIGPISANLYNSNNNPFYIIGATFLLALAIVVACVLIYWLMTPVWKIIDTIGQGLQKYYDSRLVCVIKKENKY